MLSSNRGLLHNRPIKVRRLIRTAALAAISAALLGSTAGAAEIRLLSAAAVQSVFKEITGEYEHTSGNKLLIEYATMGAINQRVMRGETADLVIGSTSSISGLVKAGRIRAESQAEICKVGVGILVPSGTTKPQVTTVDDLKRALLAARVLVYADPAGGGAAGIHIARVIEKLGLTEELKPKTKFGAGGDVTEVTLAQGSGALGMTQISEIVEKRGAEFVGPLPAVLQNYTGVAVGIPVGAPRSDAVMTFIDFLKGPSAIAAMRAKGMEVE